MMKISAVLESFGEANLSLLTVTS